MSEEAIAPAEAPKGLDNIIDSAINEHYVEPGDAPPPAAAEPEPQTDSRSRDERGRFAKAEAKDTPQGTVEAPAAPEVATVEPPAHFNAEQKATFAKLQREAQETIVSIEKAREADYTRRSQEHADFKRTADPYLQAVQPYNDYLSRLAPQIGMTPGQMVNAILSAEYRLRMGSPQEKVQAFAELAQTYGINPAAFAGGQQQQFAQHQPAQTPYIDPRLQQEIAATRQQVEQLRQERDQTLANQIRDDFANAKDENGNPKHPLFERVRNVMYSIMRSGQAEDYETAYKLATEPFKELVQQQVAEAKTKAETDRKATLEKAQKAAPVAKSTGTLPKGDTQAKGLDAHLSRALANFEG